MNYLIQLVLFLGCCPMLLSAQQEMVAVPVDAQELLIETSSTSDFTRPANRDEQWKLEGLGWMPLMETDVFGLSCGWADGWGGLMECPTGSTHCGVFSDGITMYIGCMNEENRLMGGLGLARPF